MVKKQSPTVGIIVASVGCIALSFAPGFRDVAVVWWLLGAAGIATASLRETRPRRRRRTRALALSGWRSSPRPLRRSRSSGSLRRHAPMRRVP